MNVIDQAFVKAFARRSQPQPSQPESPTESVADMAPPPAADVTVHPQAAESAVMWYDTAADPYVRRDARHPTAGPLGDTTKPQAPRSRRPSAAQPADTAADAAPVPAESPQVALHANVPVSSVDLSALYHSEVALAVQPETLVAEPPIASAPQPAPVPEVAATAPAEPPVAPALASSPERFVPVWEVDRFEFSSTVTALFSDPALVQSIGHPLDRAVNEGLQTLLITGDRTGVGQTSVATGIAISAAAAGLRVALVDATTAASGDRGALADALNLEVQQGWPETLRQGQTVAESAVHSIEDLLTVIPQATPRRAAAPTAEEFQRLIAPLREAFDLVVIDGPCCREPAFKSFTGTALPISHAPLVTRAAVSQRQRPVDAVILVQDIRDADQVLAKQVMQSLRFHGITGLGLVENFT